MCTVSLASIIKFVQIDGIKNSRFSDKTQKIPYDIKQPIDHRTFWYRSPSHNQIFFLTDNKTAGLKYFLKNIKISPQVI